MQVIIPQRTLHTYFNVWRLHLSAAITLRRVFHGYLSSRHHTAPMSRNERIVSYDFPMNVLCYCHCVETRSRMLLKQMSILKQVVS